MIIEYALPEQSTGAEKPFEKLQLEMQAKIAVCTVCNWKFRKLGNFL